MKRQDKILTTGISLIIIAAIVGVVYIQLTQPQQQDYVFPSPENVVRQYFESWGKKDYPNMYATISDGFKKIEPSASSMFAFKAYVSSQDTENITILDINEISNDGSTAEVDYSVKFLFNNTERNFTGTFTLKYRTGDIIPGWKLTHPYGDNIDSS